VVPESGSSFVLVVEWHKKVLLLGIVELAGETVEELELVEFAVEG